MIVCGLAHRDRAVLHIIQHWNVWMRNDCTWHFKDSCYLLGFFMGLVGMYHPLSPELTSPSKRMNSASLSLRLHLQSLVCLLMCTQQTETVCQHPFNVPNNKRGMLVPVLGYWEN
ncbi:unnamed protein product [Prunus armeniaca]|uniref:Uncharacterized protein n=1 Tax=Prunus armeniaca TaxID=36596 RepID=A0A6J5XKC5_PRUAR|nr:unnamed protein product [Prunus armeniaca]